MLKVADSEVRHAVARLEERYSQHRDLPSTGPVLAVDVERCPGWSARLVAGLP